MKKITEVDTYFSKLGKQNRIWSLCALFGTVTQCLVEPTVLKCAHKIPKFIQNSAKVHQTPLITDEKFI